ncbi:hypothetical protein L9F63_021039, partial [Diploptera punctata]
FLVCCPSLTSVKLVFCLLSMADFPMYDSVSNFPTKLYHLQTLCCIVFHSYASLIFLSRLVRFMLHTLDVDVSSILWLAKEPPNKVMLLLIFSIGIKVGVNYMLFMPLSENIHQNGIPYEISTVFIIYNREDSKVWISGSLSFSTDIMTTGFSFFQMFKIILSSWYSS